MMKSTKFFILLKLQKNTFRPVAMFYFTSVQEWKFQIYWIRSRLRSFCWKKNLYLKIHMMHYFTLLPAKLFEILKNYVWVLVRNPSKIWWLLKFSSSVTKWISVSWNVVKLNWISVIVPFISENVKLVVEKNCTVQQSVPML